MAAAKKSWRDAAAARLEELCELCAPQPGTKIDRNPMPFWRNRIANKKAGE